MIVQLIPNSLTVLRLLASPLLVWLIVNARFELALVVVGLAGVTDWLDGYSARKLNVSSSFGLILDPFADKVLLVTLFCALTYAGLLPRWVLALVLGRDLVIVIGALLLRIYRNIRRFAPTIWGKCSTFFQLTLVLFALLLAAYPNLVIFWLERTALVLAALFTLISGIGYVRIGIRMTRAPALKWQSETGSN